MTKTLGRNAANRSGFTLVELLVVITIIGILMGLLIPAVNAARETARRNQCSTQINNLAKAAIQYEMQKKSLPGWLNDFGSFTGTFDPSDPDPTGKTYAPHVKIGSWIVSLLPSLDAQPTYENWSQDKYPLLVTSGGNLNFTANASPNIAILQCPSSTTLDSPTGRNSYIANNGMYQFTSADTTTTLTPVQRSPANAPTASGTAVPVTFSDSMSKDNGVFNQKYAYSVTSPATPILGPAVKLEDFKDGQGNTVLFSENLQAIPWHQLHSDENASENLLIPASAGVTSVPYPVHSRFTQGFVWHYEDPGQYNGAPAVSTVRGHAINGAIGTEDIFITRMLPTNSADLARPSSAHGDGVNMGFADGSSKSVQDSIDYRVYQAMMTPRGKSSLVPFREYVLKGEAL